MAELYLRFGQSMSSSLDFSNDALISLYNKESYGTELSANNGFAVGKQYLNLQVNMWREDLRRGWIFKHELYSSGDYPTEWLDAVLESTYDGASYNDILLECRRL